MRLRPTIALLLLAGIPGQAAVVDRVAVIVGRRAIKTSDIDREIRVSSFMNREKPDTSDAARRKVAERLVDQELVRQDLITGQFAEPTQEEANEFLQQFVRERFNGNDARFRSDLATYHLTEAQLRRHLLWQLTVLRFIDQRFRPGVLVTDEDAAAYYRDHRAELERAYPGDHSVAALTPKIRDTLTGERVNRAFEDWLVEARRNVRVEFRPQAFQGGSSQ